jgi:hypothetical protein
MKAASFKSFLYDQYLCMKIFRDSYKKYAATSTKNPWRRYLEAQQWLIKKKEFCKFYYAWRLNAAGSRPNDFISRKDFLKLRSQAEKKLVKEKNLGDLNYDVLTKDKFIAGSFLLANSIPCVTHLCLISAGEFIAIAEPDADLESLLERENELFIKNVSLEASDGVIHCLFSDAALYVNDCQVSLSDLQARLSKGVWIIQRKFQSHPVIRAVNASALNTTRIVTILDKGKPRYLTGFQAFATGTARTDSWDKGSIYVGIDTQNGCLKEYGFHNLSDRVNSISTRHPDSGVEFKGYRIPHLKEAVDLCVKAHRLFYNNFIIGWDVAITENGPLIVEANEKPGMNAVQCVDGGLRKQILACYDELMKGNEDD